MAAGASDRDHGPIGGVDRRKAALTVLLAVALAAGAVAVVGQVGDMERMLDAVRQADKAWFAGCLVGQLMAYAGYVLAYRDVARADGGPRLSYGTTARMVALGFGAYILGAAAGGLAVEYWALHRAGADPHEAARRVLALNTLQWAVLASMAALAGLAVTLGWGDGVPPAMALGWLAAVPACMLAAWWVTRPGRLERLERRPGGEEPRLRSRDPRQWARWAGRKLRSGLADAIGGLTLVRHVARRPHRYPAGLAGFPLYWVGDLVTLYAALRAFAPAEPVPAALVLAYVTGYVATALPLPAGGTGGIELALAFSLHLVGVPLEPAILAVLVYRLFTFWLPIAPALLVMASARRLARELPETPREGASTPRRADG